jgi:type I restriction enzyme M protein
MSPTGYAAAVMWNRSMSGVAGGEDDIRKSMAKADATDCVISMPGQLFFGVQMPVCVWVFTRAKLASNQNGRKHGHR